MVLELLWCSRALDSGWMNSERNPQAEQMAHESMLRTLAAQAEALWPAEEALFARYGLRGPLRIADIGCGSGEITSRLAALYPEAQLLGVDILESTVAQARKRHARLAPRVRFEQGDAFHLALGDESCDLVVCRHVTQAVPDAARMLAELYRICKSGGWLHVLSEDYGMLHMPVGALDSDRLWYDGAFPYTRATGTDARVGRHTWAHLRQLGVTELRVDYMVVDTERVPRATFAAIIEAWRDGYAEAIGRQSRLTTGEVRALMDQIIADILDPECYAVWHVPVVSGRKP
jgi:ubiquinone/menaquinone biosynthesis C-methylase UbiE